MPRQYKIFVKKEGVPESTIVKGEIPDSEVDILERFIGFSNDLFSLKKMKEGLKISLTIEFIVNEGWVDSSEKPSREDYSTILHYARPFLLQNEVTFLPNILKIIGKNVENEIVRSSLKYLKDMFLCKISLSFMQMGSKDYPLNGEKAFQDWINAFEFHRDGIREERLIESHWLYTYEAIQSICLSNLKDKLDAINFTRRIVLHLLDIDKKPFTIKCY